MSSPFLGIGGYNSYIVRKSVFCAVRDDYIQQTQN
jgi:hypothetical protein